MSGITDGSVACSVVVYCSAAKPLSVEAVKAVSSLVGVNQCLLAEEYWRIHKHNILCKTLLKCCFLYNNLYKTESTCIFCEDNDDDNDDDDVDDDDDDTHD